MKFRLPRLSLLPQHLLALDAKGDISAWRLCLRWDGRHALKPAALPPARSFILVIDRVLPYRRKLQRTPPTAMARLALLRAAPDEFPFPAEDLYYGLGRQGAGGAESYLYALPASRLNELQERQPDPVMILVADGAANSQACLDAVENYLQLGSSADLLRRRRFISRRLLWQAMLGSAMALAMTATITLLVIPDSLTHVIEWRLAPLRERGNALPRLYQTTEKMAYAQAQAAQFVSSPESRLPALLAKINASIPAGHSLRSLELKDGVLKLYGNGGNVHGWLTALGFSAEHITIEDGGSFKRFRAEKSL